MGQAVGRFGWFRAGPLRAGTTGPPPPKLPGEVEVGQAVERFGEAGARWWAAPLPDPPPQTARGREVRRTMSERDGSSPLPPAVRGGEAGRGGARTQFDAFRRASPCRLPPTSPRVFWGRLARFTSPEGAPADEVRCCSSSPDPAAPCSSPLSVRNERGGAGGGAGGGAPRPTPFDAVRRGTRRRSARRLRAVRNRHGEYPQSARKPCATCRGSSLRR